MKRLRMKIIFIYIAELDENDDWTDPQIWIKANPNMNVSVNLKDMESVYYCI